MSEPYSQPQNTSTTTQSIIQPRKTMVSVIREEYVAITGKFELALILNQLIYWTERVNDFDQFIQEENKRKEFNGTGEPEDLNHGWIYKTAFQLSKELMTGWSDATTGRHLKQLIDLGFVEVRQNPKYMWNQTRQYRVNLIKVSIELQKKGYSLAGYTFLQIANEEDAIFTLKNQKFKMKSVPLKETTVLRATTTSTPTNVTAPMKTETQENEKKLLLLSLEKDVKKLIDLIPSHNLTEELRPQFNSLISKALKTHTVDSIALAITYTTDKSKGSPFEFKSYLGKTLLNNFHVGYVSKEEALRQKQEKLKQIEQDRKDAEFLKRISERQRQEELRLRDQLITQTLNDLKINNLSKYKALQEQAVNDLKAHAPRKYDLEGAFVKSKMGVLLGL